MNNITINQALVSKIEAENKEFGYTASNYEVAGQYIQESLDRVNVINSLVGGFKPGRSTVATVRLATRKLAALL